MAEIAEKNQISVHKVVYWMNKYAIPRRTRSEANYLKYNPLGDPFKISVIDRELLALAIGLFLGEGTKKQNYSVRFTNSNIQIVQIFLTFLRNICNLKTDKIKAWLNIFDDCLYPESLEYWSTHTGIIKRNFYKPVIRPQKIGTYKNKSKYGTITIIVSNTKLLHEINTWCKMYLQKYADLAQW